MIVNMLTERGVPPTGSKYPATNGRKSNVLWEQEYVHFRGVGTCVFVRVLGGGGISKDISQLKNKEKDRSKDKLYV